MKPEPIHTVAVLGLGTMGHGIAQAFATSGCRVRCYDESPIVRSALADRIRSNLGQMVEAGIHTPESTDRAISCITVFETEAEAVASAQFVTEAIREDLPVKRDLFARIEALVSRHTVLASNTSTFPMTQIATVLQHPERAVNTHWFNPPHIVPLVEIVPGEKTSEQTVRTALDLMQRLGKMPVRLNKEIPGFLVNRIQVAMFREIWDLLDRGIASPEDIDRAVQGSMGLRLAAIGSLEVNDFAGLDVTASVYKHLVADIRSDTQLPFGIQDLIDNGHFGVKTGKGIYDYTPESIEEKRARRDRRYLALIKLLYGDTEETGG